MKTLSLVVQTSMLCAGLAACGGSQSHVEGHSAPADAPEWVHRGSRVQAGSIFGVGAVTGIKNPALARDTASNRGRAEISKILEVYSASLMKDYQASVTAGDFSASSEEQMVTQAIKTFSSNLMNGTETKDMWIDQANGTWYALVELNFERAREAAAAQAEMSPGLKGWLDDNGDRVLSDLEGDTNRGEPGSGEGGAPESEGSAEPSAPPPTPPTPSTPTPPPADDGPKARVGGAAPAWTQGQCDRQRYLCGVGDGPERRAADNDARAELARIFQANIASVQQSFEGAAQTISDKTGERWVEVQKVSSFSMVSTDKVVSMSEILERWDDGKGKIWSLAVIDRARASSAFRDRIEGLDRRVMDLVSKARGSSDRIGRLKHLKSAVQVMLEREAVNSDLRVISGNAIPSPIPMSEILAMLDSASEALRMGIAIAGLGAERVQACLEDAMTSKGYQIEAKLDENKTDLDISGNFDVVIKGQVRAESRGKVAGSQVVQTTLTLKLINGKTKKILRTITDSEKGTRPDLQSAASTSAFKLCQRKVPEMVRDIDRYFAR